MCVVSIILRHKNFKDDESGALLVFFALCAAAIFLVAALSFDIGKRASTQTELQSFADNVALAAAGELDGFDNAIIRANTAAANLITDDYVFGTMAGNTNTDSGSIKGTNVLKGTSTYQIFYYETLPADDTSPLTGALDQSDRANDRSARFVRVVVNPVEVQWSFAKLLTIFDNGAQTTLDSLDEVNAEAVAGYTSLACDVAPIFFCMPENNWDPEDHIGEQVLVRTGQQGNSFWDSGNFGWLDVRETIPDESLVLDGGDCDGLTGNPLLICLIAAEKGVVTCFENGLLTTLPGQKQGIESAVFNTRFDMYNATTSQYKGSSTFQPAPIITRGFEDNGGDVCVGNATQDIETMPFPRDDCFRTDTCQDWGGVGRFGEGDWSGRRAGTDGRLNYVEANYSDITRAGNATPGTVNTTKYDAVDNPEGELYIVDEGTADEQWYHIDDPFRPGNPNNYPVILNGSKRFDYYRAEVAATYYTNPQDAFDKYGSDPTKVPNSPLRNNPLSLFPGDRSEDGLPKCAVDPDEGGVDGNFSLDPRRRVVVAAVVNCTKEEVKGKTVDVKADYFVEVFITEPVKGDATAKEKFDMYIELIGPPINVGYENVATGTFRNLVQLYR